MPNKRENHLVHFATKINRLAVLCEAIDLIALAMPTLLSGIENDTYPQEEHTHSNMGIENDTQQ